MATRNAGWSCLSNWGERAARVRESFLLGAGPLTRRKGKGSAS